MGNGAPDYKNEEQCQRVLQNVHTLDPNISLQLQSTLYGSSILSVEDVNHVQNKEMSGEKRRIAYFVSSPEFCQLCDIAGEQVVVRVEHLPMFNFSPKYKRCAKARTNIWSSSKDGSSSCRCTTTLTGTRNARKRYANNIQFVSQPMPKYPLEGRWTFLRPGEEEHLVWEPLLQATYGRCNSVGADMMYIFAERGLPVSRCSSPW